MLTGCASQTKYLPAPESFCEAPNEDHLIECVEEWQTMGSGTDNELLDKLGEVSGDARDCAAKHSNLVQYIAGCAILGATNVVKPPE